MSGPLERAFRPDHAVIYGVSNTATCECGEKFHGAMGEDVDFQVFVHSLSDEVRAAIYREAADLLASKSAVEHHEGVQEAVALLRQRANSLDPD